MEPGALVLHAPSVSAVPDDESPEVGGVQNTMTNLGASLGTALAGSLLIASLTSAFLTNVAQSPAIPDSAKEQAQVELDQSTYDRQADLVQRNVTPKANYDQARFTLQADKSKVASLKQQAEVQLAKLGGNPDIPVTEHPQYQQAKAQVDEAQRQLYHTIVKAPFAGIVTNLPSIAPGKYLQASTTALYLVATDHVWVNANPKETELTHVRPGQPVTVTVDTYPDLEWLGTVESISPAAAQMFQLLPAQNTSGNWVKVVQRIPMRVRVDTSDNSRPPLRAGMSVEIDVDTGHARGVPSFLSTLFRTTSKGG